MRESRICAEFCADFPDDSIEDGAHIVQFGGRGVTEAIAEIFRGLGYETTPLEYVGEHGWEFEARATARLCRFQITSFGEDFILQSFYGRYWRDLILKRPGPSNLEMLTQLNDALAQDARFSNVRWQLDGDLTSGAPGTAAPLTDD